MLKINNYHRTGQFISLYQSKTKLIYQIKMCDVPTKNTTETSIVTEKGRGCDKISTSFN